MIKKSNNIEEIDNCSGVTKDVEKDFILTQNQIQRKRKIDSEYYQLFSIEKNQDQDLIDTTELKKLKVHCEILLESNKDTNLTIKLIESVEKLSKSLDSFKEEIKNEISNKFQELKNQINDSNTELLGCFNLMREDYKTKINNMDALLNKISDSTDCLGEIKSNKSTIPKNIIKANHINGGVKYKIYNHQQPPKIEKNPIDIIKPTIEKPIIEKSTIRSPHKKHHKNNNNNNNYNNYNNNNNDNNNNNSNINQ
ncbi:hypothetical protein ACTFIZ_008122 [Dictyostelium cf. discoideum]